MTRQKKVLSGKDVHVFTKVGLYWNASRAKGISVVIICPTSLASIVIVTLCHQCCQKGAVACSSACFVASNQLVCKWGGNELPCQFVLCGFKKHRTEDASKMCKERKKTICRFVLCIQCIYLHLYSSATLCLHALISTP